MLSRPNRHTVPAKILVTGANGQVGWEVQRTLAPLGQVVALHRADVDLADGNGLRDIIRTIRPSVIVNAAAYTAVDQAEQDRALAFAVNADAPRVMAEEASRLNCMLVHYSTDYVFDGASRSPYAESDTVSPINVYGESKLAGELAITAVAAPHLIFRTSWVYGARGRNFARTILQLAHEREELRIVNDQVGVPTPARLIAEVTALVLNSFRAHGDGHLPADAHGLFHLAARGEATWFEFAKVVLSSDPNRAAQQCRVMTPITSAEFVTPARRPAYSVLDPSRLEQQFHLQMPEWTSVCAMVMDELQ